MRDAGLEIARQQFDDVFRPFWQAHASKLGTGLGLATTRGILEARGGEIDVDRVGPGATSRVSLRTACCAEVSAVLLT